MVCSQIPLRLLARADPSGTQEALIGDVLEEIYRGRSRWWLCQQLIGLYGLGLAAHIRHRGRLTPSMVVLTIGAGLLGGLSIASVSSVLGVWLSLYLAAGTLSLFAHMAARAQVDARL